MATNRLSQFTWGWTAVFLVADCARRCADKVFWRRPSVETDRWPTVRPSLPLFTASSSSAVWPASSSSTHRSLQQPQFQLQHAAHTLKHHQPTYHYNSHSSSFNMLHTPYSLPFTVPLKSTSRFTSFAQIPKVILPHDTVCLSVRLSHAGIVPKRLNIRSRKQCHMIAMGLYFSGTKDHSKIPREGA